MGHDWHPGDLSVETVTDPRPMLDRLRTTPTFAHREPEPVPAESRTGPWPRRWWPTPSNTRAGLAEGGPESTLPNYWTAL